MVLGLGPLVRGALPPLLLLLVASRGQWWDFLAFFALPPAVLLIIIRQLQLTYTFTPAELVIREGVLRRRTRHIPYRRIQNVETVQRPLARWLGVAEARLQTGGGQEPEAVLRVLALPAIDELRERIAQRRAAEGLAAPLASDPSSAASAPPLLQLSLREAALYGLLRGRGLLMVAAVLGALLQYADNLGVELRPERLVPLAAEALPHEGLAANPWLRAAVVAFLALALILGLRVLGMVAGVLRLGGFVLIADGDLLRSRYGLLTRYAVAIPRHRIQLLAIESKPLHRLLERASVRAVTAASFARERGRVGAQWLAPIIDRGRVAELVEQALPGAASDGLVWRGMAPAAVRRLRWRYLALALLLPLLLVPNLGPGALLGWLLTVPWAWWAAGRVAGAFGYAWHDGFLAVKRGFITRELWLTRVARVQAVVRRKGLIDRRWGMATVFADTAGGETGPRIEIPLLEAGEAELLYTRLRDSVAATELRW